MGCNVKDMEWKGELKFTVIVEKTEKNQKLMRRDETRPCKHI